MAYNYLSKGSGNPIDFHCHYHTRLPYKPWKKKLRRPHRRCQVYAIAGWKFPPSCNLTWQPWQRKIIPFVIVNRSINNNAAISQSPNMLVVGCPAMRSTKITIFGQVPLLILNFPYNNHDSRNLVGCNPL